MAKDSDFEPGELGDCHVCGMEFPHAAPNEAVTEGQLQGWQGWVQVCAAHRGHLAAVPA